MTPTNQQGEKITDKNFIDWESHVFGYGYGTGEIETLKVLKTFIELCNGGTGGQYDYGVLAMELTPEVTWLLINTLCHCGIIEYGTSTRYGWLTKAGVMLKEYLAGKTFEELYEIISVDEDFDLCSPDCCNCGDNVGKKIDCNPLFKRENL